MPVREILVTGCAGFIGARVSEMLLASGDRVVGVDNLNDAYDLRLKQWRLNRIQTHRSFTFEQADITKPARIRDIFSFRSRPFDAVINLAARAGVRQSIENPSIYFETNVNGTLNLLELSREYAVPKFVLASSSSLYGDSAQTPFREELSTDFPLSPYAASKKAAEVLCHSFHHLYGIDITIFRYFTVFGPAGRPDMAPFRFVQWISEERPVTIYGDGSQSRDFTFVDDIARGTIAGLRPLNYEIINLGSDQPITLINLIQSIEKLVGKRAQIRFEPRQSSEVQTTWADISKAQNLLDWRPQTQFLDALEKLVSWYRDNQSWARHVITH